MVFRKGSLEVMEIKYASVSPAFWKDKKVFLTGHTGFKGGWLSLWLHSMGARITGYSLAPLSTHNLFDILQIGSLVERSYIADIRDFLSLKNAMRLAEPDIVIHMAAQPLVRYSYLNPVETYETNIMGTVNLLECLRYIDSVRATLIVTTDKCYQNKEWFWGYRENEPMGGYDPYSSSKGCAELVTAAYRQSYFMNTNTINHIASARAGNVIGGGDWSNDRLVPDAIRSFEKNETVTIRNSMATRPWQHVLEPLSGYMILCQSLYNDGEKFSSAWNFGPRDGDNRTVSQLINLLAHSWGCGANWKKDSSKHPHEATFLKLDCSKAHAKLGWMPKWDLETAILKTVDWHKSYHLNEDMRAVSLAQVQNYQITK